MTKAPANIMYASVVSKGTIRIALVIAALNFVEEMLANILIQAPVTGKVWTMLGPNVSKTKVIVRALYGMKSAGEAFSSHLARCMKSIGYLPC